MSGIPRIIHQTWKDERVPRELQRFQRTWIDLHPGWEYRLWTDASARAFVAEHEPGFLPVYDAYEHFIERVDAVRYLWLDRLGGVYADLDCECLRALDPLLEPHGAVLGEEPAEHGMVRMAERWLPLVGNAFMASIPGHGFWTHVRRRLLRDRHAPDPLDATGPRMLTRAVADAGADAPSVLAERHIYPATRLQCERAGRDSSRMRLPRGAYVVHHWQGTWWRAGAIAANAARA